MANMEETEKNDNVGLFLRAMVDREPGKRKVKPSKTALIDLAELDLGESSDDSDFNVDEAKLKEDDDISINSDPDDDEDDGDSESDEEDDAENDIEFLNKNHSLSIGELLACAQQNAINGNLDAVRPKILVCAICLGDYSDDTDEIVICDGCHVSVHEGCYGISDTISVSSTVSSSSTEPWFCDSCKAGVHDPTCELCPNLGYTMFKETETGKWTHLVCALYVPGVAFGEVDKLSFPTLFEMPYSRFGAKSCSLCEDERFCRTGVCIGCDAGMCRSYFHVTCAQREGLLTEVNHGEADQADPYYAHCKMHSDKEQIRRRKRNWLSLQLNMKQGAKNKLEESQKIQDRLQRKLEKYKEKYLFTKASRPTPWFPTQKMPRSLSTSAFFFRSLLLKTELMGVKAERETVPGVGDIKKKWHVPPAFSIEYISYYLDRVSRLQELKNNLEFLLEDNKRLVKCETDLRDNYATLEGVNKSLNDEGNELMNKALELHDVLKKLAGRPLRLPPIVASLQDPLVASVSYDKAEGGRRIITKAAAKMITGALPSGTADHSGNRKESRLNLNTCHVCQLNTDQHLLIQCDTCTNYYHLNCLDPPLSRMPKKTKQMGWQCSDCCKSSDSDRAAEIDMAAPRKLRRIIKEPAKFSPSVVGDPKKFAESMSPSAIDSAKNNLTEALNVVPLKPTPAKSTKKPCVAGKRRASRDGTRGRKKLKRKGSFRSRSDSETGLTTPKSSPLKSDETPTRGRPKKSQVKVAKPETITAQLRKLQNIVTTRQPTVNLVPCKILPDSKERKISDPLKVDSTTEYLAKSDQRTPTKRSANKVDEQASPKVDTKASATPALSNKSYRQEKGSLTRQKSADEGVSPAQRGATSADEINDLMALGPGSNCGTTGEQNESGPSTTTSSLPSPPTESVPSDEALSPRKEKRHREGKKKKKDKDKESDVPRKKKKHHHRDKSHLAEMASQIVSPFRLKIKPLPPRPSELAAVTTASSPLPTVGSHTTTTTTAPPGYPPLPPGYTLTRPLPVGSNNSSESAFQLPYITVASGSNVTTAVISQKVTAGRRKSDNSADQFSKCDVCGEMGGVTNTVACDECQKAYHFNCLDPPLKKSPKRRGCSWFCEDCDNGPTPFTSV